MKSCLLLLGILVNTLFLLSQSSQWITRYEQSGGFETPRYPETIEYCKKLDAASPMITMTSFGKSLQDRDLWMVIADRDGFSDPESIRAAGRTVVMIQACIHAGESDGKDAGLMLLRDLIIDPAGLPSNDVHRSLVDRGQAKKILDHVSLLFIPIFNADGHERFGPHNRINQNGPREMGWRTNAGNLNLNRDYLKADAPEMKAWLANFNRWLPDLFIDTHTTDGADYQYVITYLVEVSSNMDDGLKRWSNDLFIPHLLKTLPAEGYPIFPYVTFRNWHDPRSGLVTGAAPPMLSQAYTALRNRPGLLIETHMLKPYRQRVESTYACLLASLDLVAGEGRELHHLVETADRSCVDGEFLHASYPLDFKTIMTDSTMVDFLGIKYEEVPSEITGKSWFRYGTDTVTYRIPYFDKTKASEIVTLPYAYIIPTEWPEVIGILDVHGIKKSILSESQEVRIQSYRFKNPTWQQAPYEGRHPLTNIEFDTIEETRWFPAGSVVVELNQQAARIIPHLLEPRGNGSLLYWGFFDPMFEQKEYGESYVLEPLANVMLQENPSLKAELEKKKASDPEFAKSQWQMLNWFYAKTPFADQKRMMYPVGRIMDSTVINSLKR